jgi:hypothetical protein
MVTSRVRALRRRVRCVRKGHYWLQRMSAEVGVQVFCARCGRVARDRTPAPAVIEQH